jgi:glutamine amidotransferase
MITIIDFGLGNLGSVKNALDTLGVESVVSSKIQDIRKASGLILPGVGAAGEGMKNIKKRKLDISIAKEVQNGKPLLGICLGMQLLLTKSEEGSVRCLNFVKGSVNKFKTELKIPQIGWNRVCFKKNSALFKSIPQNSYFYFVHSYYCAPQDEQTIVTTNYGEVFCSALQKNNIYGVQFHPEKSGRYGLQLLTNFINIVYENNTSN